MYTVKGVVIHGDGYGRKLGFPTMNLDVGERSEIPAGVYAGKALVDGVSRRAGIIIGPGEKVEAHVLGYSGDTYGKEVTFHLEKFIREYKKFDTEEELIIQIKKDLVLC